jgi:fructosamine-3-kinase
VAAADGWRERVPLHQLHLLLVHTAAFGGATGARSARRPTRPRDLGRA